jgi:hypothetical protein
MSPSISRLAGTRFWRITGGSHRPACRCQSARENIAASDVAGFDETGLRVEEKLAWVHCARTGKYTLLTAHHKRGRQAIEAMGVLPAFAGIAVHDAWAPYDGYPPGGSPVVLRTLSRAGGYADGEAVLAGSGGARAGGIGIITGLPGRPGGGRMAGSGPECRRAAWYGSAPAP